MRTKKLNKWIFEKDYVIGLASNTNNKFYVDFEDYEKLKIFTCYENSDGYIKVKTVENGKRIEFFIHRYIMQDSLPFIHGNSKVVKIQVDHENRNKKDCRKNNLVVKTNSENQYNQAIRKQNKSGITGVFFDNTIHRWIAQIGYTTSDGIRHKIRFRFKSKKKAISQRKDLEAIYIK